MFVVWVGGYLGGVLFWAIWFDLVVAECACCSFCLRLLFWRLYTVGLRWLWWRGERLFGWGGWI